MGYRFWNTIRSRPGPRRTRPSRKRFLCAPARVRRGLLRMTLSNSRRRGGRGTCGRFSHATAAQKSRSRSKRGNAMARRPLGRGLDALIGSTSAEPANGNDHGNVEVADGGAPALMMIRIESITPSPFQPRRNFDPERLRELADAIRSQGVIEPLIVRRRPGDLTGREYELVAGERRLRAAREAGLEHVPVVARDL